MGSVHSAILVPRIMPSSLGAISGAHGGHWADWATASLQVLPDADPESVVNQLVGASCGAAGGPNVALKMLIFSKTYCFFHFYYQNSEKKRHGKNIKFQEVQRSTRSYRRSFFCCQPDGSRSKMYGHQCSCLCRSLQRVACRSWGAG